MTVEAIKEAIVHLTGPERLQIVEWIDELKEDAWDRQMEADFASGGRYAFLFAEVDTEIDKAIANGKVTSLEEGLRQHRDRHFIK